MVTNLSMAAGVCEILVEIRLASAQRAHKWRIGSEAGTMSAEKSHLLQRRQNLLGAQGILEGRLVVQIIHFPDTDSRTNTLDSASWET